MNQSVRAKIALVASVAIIASAIWFWALQVGDVMETLRLAG